jgi:hypothetical protein
MRVSLVRPLPSPLVLYFPTVYAKGNPGAAPEKGTPHCQYSELERGVYLNRVLA